MNVYESVKKGLQEAVDYNHGKLKARSSTIAVKPLEDFSASDIKQIRTELEVSQTLFASMLGVSSKTVEAWELGRNTPEGPAKRLLSLAKNDSKFFIKNNIIISEKADVN